MDEKGQPVPKIDLAGLARHGAITRTRLLDAGSSDQIRHALRLGRLKLDSEEWHLDPRAFRSDRELDFHHGPLGLLTLRLIWEHVGRRPDTTAVRLHAILAARRLTAA